MSQRPCIVIVGRANVGKSSLFNRILGRRAAVVHDRPGVTRDRHFREWEFEGRTYDLVDTGGFIDEAIDPLAEQVRNQIDIAVAAADVVLFLVDARTGVTYDDLQIARHVLRREKPLLLLANKSERPQDREERDALRQLGMGEALPVSATTGYGMEGFIERLRRILPKGQGRGPRDEMVRMAILGRPNSGKSTLVNKLLGEDRVIVSPIPGTTRDSVDAEFVWEGHKFQVTDTAGLRKKAKVKDDVEYYSNMRALESIRRSEVVVLLADSLLDMKDEGLSEQDLRIMRQVEESGKGLVIGLSKWDALEKDHRTFDEIVKEMRARVSSIAETPIVAFSGQTGQRVPKLLEEVMRVREGCRRVLGRENVIEYFLKATDHQKPPHSHGKPVRITRCCQVTCDPPMLAFETDSPDDVAESYRRYLRQRAIDHFNLAGVPLRIAFRTKLELRTDEDLARFGDLPEGHELLKVPTASATPENPSEDP